MRLKLLLLAGCLAAVQPADAAWREASSPHFLIYSEESAASLRAYSEKLERFDAALRKVYPVGENSSANRLTIFALRNAAAVRKLMGAKDSNVAGVYRGSVGGSVALTSPDGGGEEDNWAEIVLLHEYAHHFMLQHFPAVYPTWYVEGFAEFVSTARFHQGSVDLGLPAAHRAYAFATPGAFPFARVVNDDLQGASSLDLPYVYGIAWGLTHYLTFGKTRHGQLTHYLQAINGGEKPAEAAQKYFGDLTALRRELEDYVDHRMSYVTLPAEDLKIGKIDVRDLSPAEEAMMPIRIANKFGVSRDEAKRLEPLARSAAGAYPSDEEAQCALAELEYKAGELDAAETATDGVLAHNAQAYCGLILKGEVRIRRAVTQKVPAGDAAWTEARRWFLKANRLALENPLPIALYYYSFRAAGVPASNGAVSGMLLAAKTAPQDTALQLAAASELVRQKRDDEGIALLRRITASSHDEKAAAALSPVIGDIGKADPERLAKQLEAVSEALRRD